MRIEVETGKSSNGVAAYRFVLIAEALPLESTSCFAVLRQMIEEGGR